VDDALSRIADAVERDPELGAIGLELIDLGERHLVDERQAPVGRRDRVVRGRDGLAGSADADPRARNPENACGLVTSWTRWRSTASTAGAPGSWVTTWSAQILSTMVRGAGAVIWRAYQRLPARAPEPGRSGPKGSCPGRTSRPGQRPTQPRLTRRRCLQHAPGSGRCAPALDA
jgi:hypothetical protein